MFRPFFLLSFGALGWIVYELTLRLCLMQRDTESLREYVNSMNSEEAREVMQKMVDSGLWVPNPQDPGMCCPSGPSERSSKQ